MVVFSIISGSVIVDVTSWTKDTPASTSPAASAGSTSGRRGVRGVPAVPVYDIQRDGVPVGVCVLLPVCTRLGGETRAMSCDTYACAYVAAEENPRVMYIYTS